jgi:uncharacterized SAM-binding protein YcdF (DUF218 family)
VIRSWKTAIIEGGVIRARPGRFVAAAGLLVAVFMAFASAGQVLIVRRWVGAPDAILVLASHEWERLPVAVQMARSYPSAVILLTNVWRPDDWSCYRCAERPDLLERAGIARNRIRVLPRPVSNTMSEAQAAADYVRTTPVNRLLVVTSPYHSRRALAVFCHVLGADRVEIGVEPATRESGARPWTWWAHSYDGWYVPYEWAALTKYALEYKVSPFVQHDS